MSTAPNQLDSHSRGVPLGPPLSPAPPFLSPWPESRASWTQASDWQRGTIRERLEGAFSSFCATPPQEKSHSEASLPAPKLQLDISGTLPPLPLLFSRTPHPLPGCQGGIPQLVTEEAWGRGRGRLRRSLGCLCQLRALPEASLTLPIPHCIPGSEKPLPPPSPGVIESESGELETSGSQAVKPLPPSGLGTWSAADGGLDPGPQTSVTEPEFNIPSKAGMILGAIHPAQCTHARTNVPTRAHMCVHTQRVPEIVCAHVHAQIHTHARATHTGTDPPRASTHTRANAHTPSYHTRRESPRLPFVHLLEEVG